MDGQLVFWSINVPDVPRGRHLYSALFGWTYSTPGPSGAVRVEGQRGSFHPSGHLDPRSLTVAVRDIDTTVARVRDLGGVATDPRETSFGATSTLTDPGGVQLAMAYDVQGSDRVDATRGDGRLAGWNLVSTDPAASATFFAGLWGWQLGDPGPTGGRLLGAAVLPCALHPAGGTGPGAHTFQTHDLAAVLAAVDRLGGSAGDPVETPAGPHAQAVDDQGTPFTLWQRADRACRPPVITPDRTG